MAEATTTGARCVCTRVVTTRYGWSAGGNMLPTSSACSVPAAACATVVAIDQPGCVRSRR